VLFLSLGLPLAVFLAAVNLTTGTESNEGYMTPLIAAPAQEPPPNRASCSAITGTDYLSVEERDWFFLNCLAAAPAGGGTQAIPPISQQFTVPAPPGHVTGVEYGIGDRLIIPSIGLDAPVNGMDVEGDALMKDPSGFFNAVWYNFAAIPGLGGYVDTGNLVMAGHVDCARCYNGLSGAAVFYNLYKVLPGQHIIYQSGDANYFYEIVGVGAFPSDSDWTAITSSGNADLTIISCTGTFQTSIRQYTHRLVVFAEKVAAPGVTTEPPPPL
jgi:hypothetical protein